MKKRILSLLLVVVLLISIFSALPFVANAATTMTESTFNTKMNTFKNSVYSNGSTYQDNSSSTLGYQCFGYANYLAKYIYGSFPTSRNTGLTVNGGWELKRGSSAIDNLHVGDIVRYRYSNSYYTNHSIFITAIDGDTVFYTDANADGKNTVKWGNKTTKAALRTNVEKYLNDQNGSLTSQKGFVAHYTNWQDTPTLSIKYHANGGTITTAGNYYLNSSLVYKTSTSAAFVQKMTLGQQIDGGLDNHSTFGLSKEGCYFAGWSLSADGGTLFDQDTPMKPETIVPDLKNGSKTITLYAIWKSNDFEFTSIGKENIYYVDDSLKTSNLSLMVKNADGSYESVTEGFTCSPTKLSKEGKETITVTYGDLKATYTVQVTKAKTTTANGTGKQNNAGYFLPSTSAGTIGGQGMFKNDTINVLCADGDFYLTFIPWHNETSVTTSNRVLLYTPKSAVTVSGSVPSAANYYTMNPTGQNNATVNTQVYVYHRTDGGSRAITYNGTDYTKMGPLKAGNRVKVLFEMDGYYCVQTSSYTGFVAKSAITLDETLCGIYVDSSTTDFCLTAKQGGEIDTSYLSVAGIYSDGSNETITGYEIELPDTATSGLKYAVIRYGGFATYVPVEVVSSEIVETNALAGVSFSVRLVEPWAMRATVTFYRGQQPNQVKLNLADLKSYGVYAIAGYKFENAENATLEDLLNDPDTIHFEMAASAEEGKIYPINATQARFDFYDGLYTYRLNEAVYMVTYYEDADGLHFSRVRSKTLVQTIDGLKNIGEAEANVYNSMKEMEATVKAYRATLSSTSLGTVYPAGLSIANSGIAFGADPAPGSYKFGTSVSIKLVEPWGLKADVRIVNSSNATIDYATADDYGVIFFHDKTGKYAETGMMAEDILAESDAQVYAQSLGNATLVNGKVSAIYDQGIFTYEMDSDVYAMPYVVINGEYYYRNTGAFCYNLIAQVEKFAAETSRSAEERAVYDAMISMNEDILAYRGN